MRIVVKVGTSTLAHPTGRQNIQRMERLCKVLSDLKNAGHEVILVSSGAIAMGVGKLNLPGRPADMPTKQAAAAIGQCVLMYFYDKLFRAYTHTGAQLRITAPDIAEGGVRIIHWNGCWIWGRCRSSMKTIPSPRMKSSSGTTIPSPPRWRPLSGRSC